MNNRTTIMIALLAVVMMIGPASAAVTNFTVTPTTTTAGVTSAYTMQLNTTGLTSLNVTIPAGYDAVEPAAGDLVARVDLWGSNPGDIANVTFTANSANPSTKVDVSLNISDDDPGTYTGTQTVSYSEGASMVIASPKNDVDMMNLTLPTATANGSLELHDLPDSIKNMTVVIYSMKNPTTAGNHTFVVNKTLPDEHNVTVTIIPDAPYKLAVFAPSSATIGDEVLITITSQDEFGNNNTTAVNKVYPSVTSGSGSFDVSSITLTNGTATVNLTGSVAETVEFKVICSGGALTEATGSVEFKAETRGVGVIAVNPSIVANGTDSTTIIAQLKDGSGNDIKKSGVTVDFDVDNTTLAGVTASNTTDSDGKAYATLTGNTVLGTVNVLAFAESYSGSGQVNLTVGSPNGTESTLEAYNATGTKITGGNAIVGGEVTIAALLYDEIGATHSGLCGESVTFSVVSSPKDLASLSDTSVTSGSTGYANTTLTLSTTAGENKVRVISANGDVNETISVWGDAAGVTLTSAVDNATVKTDVAISARLTDPITNAVINDTNVTFSVTTSLGDGDAVVSSEVVATVNGYANTTLTLSTEAGTNTVRAISTRYDVDTNVSVTGNAGNATQLNLTTDKASLPSNGEATLTAELRDVYDNPTTFNATGGDGVVNVSFAQDPTEYGELDSPAHNDTVGNATTMTFTANATSGTTTITASADGLTSDSVSIFTGVPDSISLIASPTNIPMNQNTTNSTITVQLLDEYGTKISVAGREITFTASVPGNVTLTNTSSGVVGYPLVVYTNTSGTAQINLTSTESIIEEITVTAMPKGLALKQVDVQIRGNATKIVLSADPSTGVVAGTDKSVITAQLQDDDGNDVAEAGTGITFSATAGTLSAYTVNTTSSGAAIVNLTSTTAGDITVYAVSGTLTMGTVTVGFIQVPDLIVESITPNCGGYLFGNESNNISAVIKNDGTGDAGASHACFVLSDGHTETVTVSALAAGASETVTTTDPTIRNVGDVVTITVTADCNGEVTETNETNNVTTLEDVTVVNNGYKGKTYTGGSNITTVKTYDLNGDLDFSVGDSYYLSGSSNWVAYDVAWAASDLPFTSTVREARLYVMYTWDKDGVMPDDVSMSFNGADQTQDAQYSDRKGYDGYDYPYGMLAYNVTGDFNTGGNIANLTNSHVGGGNVSMRGMLLVAIYEDASEPQRLIYVNEEFDMLYGGSGKCTTPEEATAWAPITGSIEGTVANATLITVAPGAGPTEGELIFNGQVWTDVWNYAGSSQIGIDERDVASYLDSTDNLVGFQSSADYMEASNVFLVVEVGLPKTGDIDGSGDIDMDDVVYLAKHYYGTELFPEYGTIYADGDIDCDGDIDMDDVVYLAKYYYGTELFPEYGELYPCT